MLTVILPVPKRLGTPGFCRRDAEKRLIQQWPGPECIFDPQLSVMTDDVIEGRIGEPTFRRAIVWLVGSRLVGTVLAQLLLIPAASLIVFVAEKL